MKRDLNYASFLRLNVKGYNNKWVALVDGKLVSVKNTFKEVYKETQHNFPKKDL